MSFVIWSDIEKILEQNLSVLAADMATGDIYFATQEAERMFGYTVHGELVGRNVDDLVPSTLRNKHTTHRAEYANSPRSRPMGTANLPLFGQRKDGSTFPVEIALVPAMLGSKRGVVAVLFDMSYKSIGSITSPAI